jgi:hypothetical protein
MVIENIRILSVPGMAMNARRKSKRKKAGNI